jgi:uncharacterized membrane protein YphA (DoxX/SURF4 family)
MSPSDKAVHLAAEAGRFAIGTVFLLAGLAKIRLRREFEFAVMNFELLPRRAARLVGRWLPVGEIAAAALLLLGVAIVPAAAFLAVLLAAFIAAVAVNLLRKKTMDCGCFGGAGAPRRMTWSVVGRNVVLLFIAILVLTSSSTSLALWPGWGTEAAAGVTAGDAAAMLIAGSAGVLAVLIVRDASHVRTAALTVREALR